MGARPIAALNALRFGAPDHPKTRHLVAGVVAGIGGYGNCIGVPTVGGEVDFDARYNGNILVNAMCVGLAQTRRDLLRRRPSGVGNPVVYVGSKTGRDGIHGATMASAEFDDASEEKRPTVQVGDPFTEKLLLEACLELMATGRRRRHPGHGRGRPDLLVGRDGAPRATSASSSTSTACRCAKTGMTAYEMMLSESQERMLMVLKPGTEAEAEAIFRKWDLDFAVIGKTTDTGRFVVRHRGEVEADLPVRRSATRRRSTSGRARRQHVPAGDRARERAGAERRSLDALEDA